MPTSEPDILLPSSLKDEEVWITFGEQEKRVFLAKVREIIAPTEGA